VFVFVPDDDFDCDCDWAYAGVVVDVGVGIGVVVGVWFVGMVAAGSPSSVDVESCQLIHHHNGWVCFLFLSRHVYASVLVLVPPSSPHVVT